MDTSSTSATNLQSLNDNLEKHIRLAGLYQIF